MNQIHSFKTYYLAAHLRNFRFILHVIFTVWWSKLEHRCYEWLLSKFVTCLAFWFYVIMIFCLTSPHVDYIPCTNVFHLDLIYSCLYTRCYPALFVQDYNLHFGSCLILTIIKRDPDYTEITQFLDYFLVCPVQFLTTGVHRSPLYSWETLNDYCFDHENAVISEGVLYHGPWVFLNCKDPWYQNHSRRIHVIEGCSSFPKPLTVHS